MTAKSWKSRKRDTRQTRKVGTNLWRRRHKHWRKNVTINTSDGVGKRGFISLSLA